MIQPLRVSLFSLFFNIPSYQKPYSMGFSALNRISGSMTGADTATVI